MKWGLHDEMIIYLLKVKTYYNNVVLKLIQETLNPIFIGNFLLSLSLYRLMELLCNRTKCPDRLGFPNSSEFFLIPKLKCPSSICPAKIAPPFRCHGYIIIRMGNELNPILRTWVGRQELKGSDDVQALYVSSSTFIFYQKLSCRRATPFLFIRWAPIGGLWHVRTTTASAIFGNIIMEVL